MKLYHVSRMEYKDSIESEGIRCSKGGIDGPGVYAFNSPLNEAIKNADISLSESHDDKSDEELLEYYKTLCVFEIDVPDETPCSMKWEDYRVLINPVDKDSIKFIGCLFDILMKVVKENQHEGS